MPTNKSLIFQALAQDAANANKFFALKFVFNAGTGTFDIYVEDQVNSGYPAQASQIAATGTQAGGGVATAPGGSNTQLQYNNAGAFGGVSGLTSDGTNVTAGSGNLRATSPRITTGLLDANGNEIISFTAVGSAVNEITVSNNSTGLNPIISATGGDANISIALVPKGTGSILIPDGTAALPAIALSSALSTGLFRGTIATTLGIGVSATQLVQFFVSSVQGMELGAGNGIFWGTGFNSRDLGLARNAAGILEINSGALGTNRDLRLRNLLDSAGSQVVTTRQAAVADAAGGAVIDIEARAALNALLARLRTHGLIAP